MTIKEVEEILGVPRATIRFYEKEGLITPAREGNSYRQYSDEDVEKLRQIIILRKLGIPVEDISDLFDGAKSMNEVLDANVTKLQNQMKELQGALKLSKELQQDRIEISEMDVNWYWDTIREEEQNGNQFMDVAKDIAQLELDVITSHFSLLDEDGTPYASWLQMLCNAVILASCYGIFQCIVNHSWTLYNFAKGARLLVSIIVVEMILMVPVYFLGKKIPWVEKNRKLTLLIIAAILLIIMIFVVLL